MKLVTIVLGLLARAPGASSGLACVCAILSLALPTAATAQPVRVDAVVAELVADVASVVPGQAFRIGLALQHDDDWHTYWRVPGDSGLPTQFELRMPDGFEAGPIQWPVPSRFVIPPLGNLGYEDDVLLVRQVTSPQAVIGSSVRFETLAQWLVCREVCVPGEASLSLELPVTAAGPQPGPRAPDFAATARRVPVQTIGVGFARADDMLLLRLPGQPTLEGEPRLEFFPFAEGLHRHAVAQALAPLPGGGWRLAVPLSAEFVQAVSNDPARLVEAARGVLVIDEQRGVELEPTGMLPADAFDGAGASRAIEGHLIDLAAFSQTGGGGLLDTLRSGSTSQPGGAGPTAGSFGAPAGATVASSTGGLVVDAGSAGLPGSLWVAAGLALLGGMILNLMPCVFPVIGLKILGFAGSGAGRAGLDATARAQVRRGSLWFAVGVIVSFWLLAGVLLALRSAGEAVGWGFQLQSPTFVVLMALLFVAIALNLSGVYEFGLAATRLANLEPRGTQGSLSSSGGGMPHASGQGGISAFGSGVLAVLVATPCTAPFMGSALGFTLAQPASVALMVFTALGLGMALPYLLLGMAPGWLRWVPRPGRWMETLRQFLAFPMYAVAAWLAWVLGQQSGIDAVFALALGATLMALALWLWGRQVQGGARTGSDRLFWGSTAAAILLAAVVFGLSGISGVASGSGSAARQPAPGPSALARDDAVSADGWQAWAPGVVAAQLARGRPVFVEFTAAWCLSCLVNKRLVLDTDDARALFKAHDVALVRADWTRWDPAIRDELARHGRNSVPLYLVYQPGVAAPAVLPELISVDALRAALTAR